MVLPPLENFLRVPHSYTCALLCLNRISSWCIVYKQIMYVITFCARQTKKASSTSTISSHVSQEPISPTQRVTLHTKCHARLEAPHSTSAVVSLRVNVAPSGISGSPHPRTEGQAQMSAVLAFGVPKVWFTSQDVYFCVPYVPSYPIMSCPAPGALSYCTISRTSLPRDT